MKRPLQNLTAVLWWTNDKYSLSRISQQPLSTAPSNFNLYYVSLVWEYHMREYQKPHENRHVIICCFSPYGVLCCWKEMHWFEMIWQIYAGFHSSSCYSSSTKKNKTQIWLLAQKNSGRLQLVWSIFSFFPVLKIALLNHKKTVNNSVSYFLDFFFWFGAQDKT